MAQGQEPFGKRASRAMVRFFVVLLVLGLIAAVGVLLSRLNARTFTVEQRGDSLVILKGRNLPFGAAPYVPADPRLAEAYAPIPAVGAPPASLVGVRFEDREELDRALFEVLADRAEARIASEESREQQQAMQFMRRAEKLSGITEEQQRTLRRIQGEAAFYQARYRLDEARRLTAEAMVQLRLAAESPNQNARAANQMLVEVGPAARALEESLRRAVHTLSAPAEQRPPTPAQPTLPPDAGQPQPRQEAPPEEPGTLEEDAGAVEAPKSEQAPPQ